MRESCDIAAQANAVQAVKVTSVAAAARVRPVEVQQGCEECTKRAGVNKLLFGRPEGNHYVDGKPKIIPTHLQDPRPTTRTTKRNTTPGHAKDART